MLCRIFMCSFVIYLTLYCQDPVSCASTVVGAKVLPCEAKKRIPCATICEISITYKSCDSVEGYCNCPFSCPAALKGSLYMCGKCRKPSAQQRDLCYFGNCRVPKSDALVCSDGKDVYCTCFPPVVKKSLQNLKFQVDETSNGTETRILADIYADEDSQEYKEETHHKNIDYDYYG